MGSTSFLIMVPENVCNGFTQTYDREIVPTLGVLASTPQIIRVFPTDPRDSGSTVIVQGTDQNGQTVTSTDPVTNQTILGEQLTLAFPFVQTLNQFMPAANSLGVTGLEKDGTFGPVTFFQVDFNTGVSTPLSSMEPSETSSAYRKYLIGNLPCRPQCTTNGVSQVTAMAKLEYVPIASDPDYLGIPCVPALIAECEALRYESMDNVQAQQMGVSKHAKALQLLFGQLQHYMGNERPAISVNLFGPRRHLRMQPI